MAARKWNNSSIAAQIVEAARRRAEASEQTPVSADLDRLARLPSLDAVDLQSLAVRLGAYAWKRRSYRDDLSAVSSALFRVQSSAGESLSVPQQAFVFVLDDVLKALSYGDEQLASPCQPWQIEQRVREVWRPPIEDRSSIDTAFVRSIIEPLLTGDQSAFRSLLGALGKGLVDIGARGVDRQLPNVTALLGYQQLRVLQNVLNGVLQASRDRSHLTADAEVVIQNAARAV